MLSGDEEISYVIGSFRGGEDVSEVFEIRSDYSDDGAIQIYRLNTEFGAELWSVESLFEFLENANYKGFITLSLDE
jgi:hypothetical protein